MTGTNDTLTGAPADKRKLTISDFTHRVRENLARLVAWLGGKVLKPTPRPPPPGEMPKDVEGWRSEGRN
ncbi:MAG: hypothetical protein H6Q89_810 [Myxococcaceae bacterium]|nr:hypothetical protein [Myxococcaceae bacterium]